MENLEIFGLFQSTPPAREETRTAWETFTISAYFNPLLPHGRRRQ